MDLNTRNVKILSSHSEKGGSTEALISLCNLFNNRGLDTTFFGPHDWYRNKCKSGKITIDDFYFKPNDIIISHNFHRSFNCNIHVLSCHEKHNFVIQAFDYKVWDKIHFVSNQQAKWHNVTNITTQVIPNIIPPLKKNKKKIH